MESACACTIHSVHRERLAHHDRIDQELASNWDAIQRPSGQDQVAVTLTHSKEHQICELHTGSDVCLPQSLKSREEVKEMCAQR